MPNAVVKSYAEKTGKSPEHIEGWWQDAEKEALKKFKKKSPRYWAYVNGIVKRRAGLDEALTFKELIENMKLLTTTGDNDGTANSRSNRRILPSMW